MRKDKQATMDMQFLDPRSYVTPDKREVLYGKDWKARVEDLRLRSSGKCERFTILGKPHDAFCHGEAADPHHIVPRSKGRDDRMPNLAGLSRACHSAEDTRKPRWTQRVEA